MAYFAELDNNSIVTRVIPGVNEDAGDGEAIYTAFTGNVWKRTSYHMYGGVHLQGKTPFRKNYAGVGFTYDAVRDAFIPPKPTPTAVLNEETCLWEEP